MHDINRTASWKKKLTGSKYIFEVKWNTDEELKDTKQEIITNL